MGKLKDKSWQRKYQEMFDAKKRAEPCVECGETGCRGRVFYRQESDLSCGIASARMIARDHGVMYPTEQDFAKQVFDGGATSFHNDDITRALDDFGIDHGEIQDYKSFDDIKKALDGGKNSLILGVGNPAHALVVDDVSPDGKKLLVRDPGSKKGCRELDQKELQNRAFDLSGLGLTRRWLIKVPKP
jgi:hypothetical protein